MDVGILKRPILSLKKPRTSAATSTTPSSIGAPREKQLSVWWPRPHEPHFSWVVPHPTKGDSFCEFPEIQAHGHTFEAAEVFLLYGKHWDRNKGFGVIHILEGHSREIDLKTKEPSPAAVSRVASFVASICARGAKITCEFADLRGNHRPVIVRSSAGTVVLEYKSCRETGLGYYSVVTAMAATKAKGSVIGAL